MDPWVEQSAQHIAGRAERELAALVGVSSPSGDVAGAEECIAVCTALLPEAAAVERLPCSTPGHAPDLLALVGGTGRGRILLLGHVDTVVAHDEHRPLQSDGERLVGSGAVDMKGGVVLALGVLRALADVPERFAEAALLLVVDEEWRTVPFTHTERFAGWDACLCFEAGEHTKEGAEGVVVRRKSAGTIVIEARGRSAHSGAAPERGRNALLALSTCARRLAALHDPDGPEHLTVVPTVLRSGSTFNVVPARGELVIDLRADDERALHAVHETIPTEIDGVALEAKLLRLWPGMDATATTAPLLEQASALLGRPIHGTRRGGASDASHFASTIAVTIDGLGPRGGRAHNPGEYVYADSLGPRAEVALAVVAAVLDGN